MSQILNFLWINEEILPRSGDSGAQVVPEKYLQNIKDFSARNPSTEIILWLDSELAGADRMQGFHQKYLHAGLNISLRDLQEIPLYAKDPFLQDREERIGHGKRRMLVRKADLARVYVVDYVLGTMAADSVFYCDADIEPLDISGPEISEKLAQHSVVFGCSSRNGVHYGSYLENQFFGLMRSEASFLSGLLLPATRYDVVNNGDGWEAFIQCAKARYGSIGADKSVQTKEIPGSIKRDEISRFPAWMIVIGVEEVVADLDIRKARRAWEKFKDDYLFVEIQPTVGAKPPCSSELPFGYGLD